MLKRIDAFDEKTCTGKLSNRSDVSYIPIVTVIIIFQLIAVVYYDHQSDHNEKLFGQWVYAIQQK